MTAATPAEADAALAGALASAERDTDPRVLGLLRGAAASVLLPGSSPSSGGGEDRELVLFAEAFVADVSQLTAAVRTPVIERYGAGSLGLVQALYLADLTTRRKLALAQLGLPADEAGATADLDLWPALESYWRTVARLDRLDAQTTELVRLRGAAAHRCRLCSSRRQVTALEAPGGRDLLDQMFEPDPRGLTPAQAAAVDLVDAVVWHPADLGRDLTDRVLEAFDPDEVAELLHDVVRNAANKIAVAFGADAPAVTDGVELFTLDEDGEVVVVGPSA